MVTCKLYGRLGNQLFQISTAIAYAMRNNSAWCIPQHITCPPGLTTDPVYFRHFPQLPLNTNYSELQVIKEDPSQCYTPIQEKPKRNSLIYLDGYFQSEKYFADQRKDVLQALAPSFTMTSTNPNEGDDYVSVHVRRGDYLEKPDCHPVLSYGYYVPAIQSFINRGYKRFVVFSDDIKYCKNVFFNKNVFNHMDTSFMYSTNQSPREDLQSMSKCHHHIIANSSFSWWGAWLNERPDKIVVAPKTWYGPALAHVDTKDLIPENWIRI